MVLLFTNKLIIKIDWIRLWQIAINILQILLYFFGCFQKFFDRWSRGWSAWRALIFLSNANKNKYTYMSSHTCHVQKLNQSKRMALEMLIVNASSNTFDINITRINTSSSVYIQWKPINWGQNNTYKFLHVAVQLWQQSF